MTDLRDALQRALGDAYRIERELGGASMSRVFLAEETAFRRMVVVKMLPAEMHAAVNIGRFRREIQLAASLQHPHIVPVLSAGEVDGTPYYTMPFVRGTSLREQLTRGPLTIRDAVSVLRELAKALAYAHAQGVVHRDIKPENVLLTDGTVMITDFGIAKAITAASELPGIEDPTLTAVGMTVGTPAYMAPEQVSGSAHVDHRADIYAFGCVAFELLTGRQAFQAETSQDLLVAHLTVTPPPVESLRPDVPPTLAGLVRHCLDKRAAMRPQRASELVDALDAATSGAMSSYATPVQAPGAPIAAASTPIATTTAPREPALGTLDLIGLPPEQLQDLAQREHEQAQDREREQADRARAASAGATQAALHATTPDGAVAPASAADGSAADGSARRAPRTRRRVTIAAGVALLLAGGYAGLRALGVEVTGRVTLQSTGAMAANDRVLVAEFKGPPTDSTLGAAITEAFRADLAQSDAVRVVMPTQTAATLQRMEVPPTTTMDYALARQVAQREGIKAVVDGAVVQVGSGYVVHVSLYATESGEPMATFSEKARSADELIDAVETVVRDVRVRIGESLRRVNASPSLERVTTPSLEALRKYTQAMRLVNRQGNRGRGIALLEEAVALDTGFAMAYRRLAVELNNVGISRARAVDAIAKAYAHRDRLTEPERLLTEAAYFVGGPNPDLRKSLAAHEALLEIAPRLVAPYNNAAMMLGEFREFARAESLATRGLLIDSTGAQVLYRNLFGAQLAQGKLTFAEATLERFARNLPRAANVEVDRALLAWNRRQFDTVKSRLEGVRAARPDDNTVRSLASAILAAAATTQGQLRSGVRHLDEKAHADRLLGDSLIALSDVATRAQWAAVVLEQPARATAMLDSAVSAAQLERAPAPDRPYRLLALTYGILGNAERVRPLLAAFDASRRTYRTAADSVDRATMEGALALAEGRYADAVRWLRSGDAGSCTTCMLPWIAHAYERAAQPDSAMAYFTRYLATYDASRWRIDPAMRAGAHQRLGELLEERGDRAGAVTQYQAFLELWRNADPALQGKVTAVRSRLARLQGEVR